LAIYADKKNPALFDEAYRLAKKHNDRVLMDYVDDRQSRYYIAQHQYDSAMIHILRMKDGHNFNNSSEDTRNILHLQADLYYKSTLYDKADAIYMMIYQQYKEKGVWDFWRPYVIMNNLGQIALTEKKYQEATYWFKLSLNTAESNLFSTDRNNIITYINIKLSNTYLDEGTLDSAVYYLKQAEQLPSNTIFEDVQQELIFMQSKMALKDGNYVKALSLALQLTPHDSITYHQNRFIPEIYLHLSEIWKKLSKPDSSLKYLSSYTALADSLSHDDSKARSMVLLSENNHKLIENDLIESKFRNKLLILGLFVITIIFIIVLAFYKKLHNAKLELVKKSANKNIYLNEPIPNVNIKQNNYIEENKQILLINKLKSLMNEEKLFLEPKLNIRETAGILSTNRTYLSQAINNVLETNFSGFVNQYRVNEAIKLITDKYFEHHTIEAIARTSGFASRAVFNSSFKKQTGVTPSFFITNYKKLGDK
jgi:AraC-like DNA-binding protein